MQSIYKIFLLIVSAIYAFCFISCNKQEYNDESVYKFTASLNGFPFNYTSGVGDNIDASGVSRESSDNIQDNNAIYKFEIIEITDIRKWAQVYYGKFSFNGPLPSDSSFFSYFNKGNQLYSDNAQNGIKIIIKENDTTYWTTDYITQDNSSFSFDKVSPHFYEGNASVDFEATFNCSLMNEYGDTIILNNGYCCGRFRNL